MVVFHGSVTLRNHARLRKELNSIDDDAIGPNINADNGIVLAKLKNTRFIRAFRVHVRVHVHVRSIIRRFQFLGFIGRLLKLEIDPFDCATVVAIYVIEAAAVAIHVIEAADADVYFANTG